VAIEWARGKLKTGEAFVVESVIGTRFTGRVLRETTFGPHRAVIPEVEGQAWISGRGELWFDPGDPLSSGFILR
jgi:proline racemase